MNTLNFSQRPVQRVASILTVSALALGLAGCGKTEDTSVGQRPDSIPERTEQAANRAGTAAGNTAQNAGTTIEQGATSVGNAVSNTTDRAAGAVDDATITAKVKTELAQDPDLSALKINVDTVNGKVTLNGPAPTTVARDRAETIAKAVQGVTEVHTQLVVTAS